MKSDIYDLTFVTLKLMRNFLLKRCNLNEKCGNTDKKKQ